MERNVEPSPDEIFRGDYSYLAATILDDKPEPPGGSLLSTLCNDSLGISPEREKRLAGEPARHWLGDLNWRSKATRDLSPTPVIDSKLRRHATCRFPVLMIHGDLDLATPIENAEELLKHLPNGHLIRVVGGTHRAAHYAAQADQKFMSHLSLYMNARKLRVDPGAVFGQIPKTLKLPPLRFVPLNGKRLFGRLTRDKR